MTVIRAISKGLLPGVLTLLIAMFTHPALARQPSAGVYFDGSGSMKGFFHQDAKSIRSINAMLHEALTGVHATPVSRVFVTSGDKTAFHDLNDFLQRPAWGSQTRLDLALEKASDMDMVMLVSDNVQDEGEYDGAGARRFYQLLEDASIGAVLLLPLQNKFNGPLYFYKHRHPDPRALIRGLEKQNPGAMFKAASRKSKTYHVVNMVGDKALILYIIIKQTFPGDRLLQLVKRINASFQTAPLMVKPVDQGAITLEGVNQRGDIEKSFTAFENLCAMNAGAQRIPIRKPNLELVSPQSDIYRSSSGARKQDLELKPIKKFHEPYSTDQVKRFRFYTRVSNKSRTIVLGIPGSPCADNIRIAIGDVAVSIAPSFRDCFFPPGAPGATITPDYIPFALVGGEGADSKDSPSFAAINAISIPPFRVRLDIGEPLKSLAAVVKLAFAGRVPIAIKGTIEILAPPGAFSVDPGYAERFFTRSVYEQGRVYTPEDIVAYIHERPTRLPFHFRSEKMYLETALWLKVVVYLAIAALLAGLILGYFSISRRAYLKIDDEKNETLAISLPLPLTSATYMRGGREVLVIKKGFFSYAAYPGRDYHLTDMDDNAIASFKLPSSGAFYIRGPGMAAVIAEATPALDPLDAPDAVSLTRKRKKDRSKTDANKNETEKDDSKNS